MHDLVLKAITFIHICFIIFVVASPLSGSNYFMLLHTMFIPFLVMHWVLNDNTCAITLVERFIRKKTGKETYSEDDCITCKLIEPVYNFRNDYKSHTKFIYTVTGVLWLISASRLWCKYESGEISKWQHLFIV